MYSPGYTVSFVAPGAWSLARSMSSFRSPCGTRPALAVRLRNGVFAPYTGIPTNLLCFDRSGPTHEAWYYEQPLPEGRKNYTKTQPIQFEEFQPCLDWWFNRAENDRAWKVSAEELRANNCNLDRKNPNGKQDFEHLPPEQLVEDILKKEQRIMEIMAEIKAVLKERP